MKTITERSLSQEEIFGLVTEGKNPEDFMAIEVVAMGMQMTPNIAKVKEHEGSEKVHKCIICTIPFPLPIESSALSQKKLIVPTLGGAENGTLELALGSIPKIRILMKKDAVVDTLKEDKE